MIGRILASTAVVGVLFTGAAMAQMTSPPNNTPSNQPAPIQTQNPGPRDGSMQNGQLGQAGSGATTPGTTSQSDQSAQPGQSATPHRSMTQRAGDSMKRGANKAKAAMTPNKGNKQTAQGHAKDNIADQLNACEVKPQAERQSCIDQATRM